MGPLEKYRALLWLLLLRPGRPAAATDCLRNGHASRPPGLTPPCAIVLQKKGSENQIRGSNTSITHQVFCIMGRRSPTVRLIPAILTLFLLNSAIGAEIKNSACLDCHSDKTLTATNAAGR